MHIAPSQAQAIAPFRLRSAARAALAAGRARRSVRLAVVLTGDSALRRLNREFLGLDAPTDVLSFPARDADAGVTYLGDVIISLTRAKAQARAGGHPLIDELRLLVIHGVLHLLGYDHDTPTRRRRMWAAQAAALRMVRASIDSPA